MKEKFAIYNTKFGIFRIGYKKDVVFSIKTIKTIQEIDEKSELTNKVHKQILEYFNGERKKFDLRFELRGTEFQKKVWESLLTIMYGEIRTYKQIAIQIGNEKASRAVGQANNKNPIMIVVPCHRVIGTKGKILGYSGGQDMKELLLRIEKNNRFK